MELTGDKTAPRNEKEKQRRIHIAKFIDAQDDDELILDLREMNGDLGRI